VPLASASGALVLIGFFSTINENPLGSGVWRAFSSIKKTLWRPAGLSLDKENSLVLGWH
jgi:hypothetical protein